MLVQLLCAALATAILWKLSDRSFKESLQGEFVTNGQTVAESVATSVERHLAGHDITSVQSVLDASLKTPDVVYAYVTAPDGTVLADTFVPSFPENLLPTDTRKSWLSLQMPGKTAPVAVFTHPLLTGIFGAVHVGFTEEKLLASMNRMKLLLLGTVALVMFVLAAIVGLVIRKIIAPIHALTRATTATVGDKFEALPIASGDEIGVLTASFNQMMFERQEDRNNLEARVLARTDDFLRANKKIEANQRDMRLILDNLQEGLVTIRPDGQMSGEASRALKEWFGAPLPGQKLADWIGQKDPGFAEWLELGLESVREGFLPTEVALSQLPARLKDREKTYEVRYQMMIGIADESKTEENVTQNILVIVGDITETLAHEAAERHQSDLLQVFQHMMRDKHGFLEFLAEADAIIRALNIGQYDGLDHMKRLIHTLKGNSATFGMKHVAEVCHTLENFIAEQDQAPDAAQMASLDQVWHQIRSDIARLMGEAREKNIEIDDAEYNAILEALRASIDFRTLARMVESWQMESTGKRLVRIEQQIKGMAERMGKTNVEVTLEPNDLRFSSERFAPFWSAFIHVLRNTVDHGIEAREEREKKGKPQESSIKVSTAIEGDRFVVSVADDGPGIDWERLRKKAAALGIADSASMNSVDLLCVSGLSSRDNVTELSGRGVGMAALADACKPLGGIIKVESELGVGTRIRFEFPKDQSVYEGHAAVLQAGTPLTAA
jgi:two-component system chemotaxis sensor kinase CheA